MFSKISGKEFLEFNRVFSLLLLSRISVLDALELVFNQTKNQVLKKTLKSISKSIKSGSSLSQSFSKYPELFSEVYISNLKVGEETGQLAKVLNEYTEYQDKFMNLKRKISQAVRYPIFVLVITLGVVLFMLLFLIPTFEGLFISMKTGLPPLTEAIITTSNFMISNALTIGFISISLLFIVYKLFTNKTVKKKYIDPGILKIPIVSKIYKQNLLARFSLVMSTLLGNKVELLESLNISSEVSKNSVFRNEIKKIRARIVKGDTLTTHVKQSGFFDITFTRMLVAGEESSELDKVFKMMSEYYTREFDHYLDNITSFLEPILILFIGLIVSVILIAMYLPMFEIVNYLGV